jgi:CheY-like chemotaxis protein
VNPALGFAPASTNWAEVSKRLEQIALASVRKMYSPEFVNRIDAVITYQPLDEDSMKVILDQQLAGLQDHVNHRLGDKGFTIEVSPDTRRFLLARGTSVEYGARELKRTIYRHLTQPLSTLVIEGKLVPGSRVAVAVDDDGEKLRFSPLKIKRTKDSQRRRSLLIVDDNSDFLRLLSLHLEKTSHWRLVTAQSVAEADKAVSGLDIDCALLDMGLPDGNGLNIAQRLKAKHPKIQVIIMTGGSLTIQEAQTCRNEGFQVINKPFLVADLVVMIEGRKRAARGAGLK